MNATKLSERLPALLDELAESTPVDRVDGSFVPLDRATPATGRDLGPRRFLAAAAACLVVGGLGSVAWALTSRDQPSEPPTPPAADESATTPPPSPSRLDPTLYPVIEEPPPGLEITAYVDSIAEQPLLAEVLIGRRVDGVVSDSVTVIADLEPINPSPIEGSPPTGTEVLGQPATVVDRSSPTGPSEVLVTWGTDPYVVAYGTDPLPFLQNAATDALSATIGADGRPELKVGTLPEGYEVIIEPHLIGLPTLSAVLSIGADNYDISVSTRDPRMGMAAVAPVREVDVAGRVGWMFDTTDPLTQDVAWQVDDTTFAYLKVNDGTDAAGALELARQITFVDFDSWVARYDPELRGPAADDQPTETTPEPVFLEPTATLPEDPEMDDVVPVTVVGTAPTEWYRMQPDLDVAWYSPNDGTSMLCLRTPVVDEACQPDEFSPTAIGGGPIGVATAGEQLIVLTVDPGDTITLATTAGGEITAPVIRDTRINWGIARIDVSDGVEIDGLTMLFGS